MRSYHAWSLLIQVTQLLQMANSTFYTTVVTAHTGNSITSNGKQYFLYHGHGQLLLLCHNCNYPYMYRPCSKTTTPAAWPFVSW